jgi:hypothetical protein
VNLFKQDGIMSKYSSWLRLSFESVALANRLRGRSLCGPAMSRPGAGQRAGRQFDKPLPRHHRADRIRAGLYGAARRALQLGRRFVRPGRRVRLPGRVLV